MGVGRGVVGQESGVVRGVVPEREVSGVVGEGEGEERQGGAEQAVFPNREVAAPSTGFSLWPPPIYVLVRNFIRRRRGQ